jgi:hypothetical protein
LEYSWQKKALKEEVETVLDALKRVGFKIQYDEKVVSRLAELEIEMNRCCGAKEAEDAISKLDDVDLVTKLSVQEYIGLLSMSDEEIAKEDEIRKKFRDSLRSLVKK